MSEETRSVVDAAIAELEKLTAEYLEKSRAVIHGDEPNENNALVIYVTSWMSYKQALDIVKKIEVQP